MEYTIRKSNETVGDTGLRSVRVRRKTSVVTQFVVFELSPLPVLRGDAPMYDEETLEVLTSDDLMRQIRAAESSGPGDWEPHEDVRRAILGGD